MSGSPVAVPGSTGGDLPDFDDPFAILEACHGRIERMLRTLERLPAHLGRAGADAEAVEAIARVRRYFEEAGPDHHADEERDLFPAARAAADPVGDAAASGALSALDALERQHRDMAAAWAALRDALDGLARVGGPVPADLPTRLAARVARFADLYRGHIDLEERVVYAWAKTRLDAGTRARLARAMVARRSPG